MGLDMHRRHDVTEELAGRYRAAGKREKTKILDEFTALTGYNRKYAIHLLTHWGRIRMVRIDGTLVRLKAGRHTGGVERRGRKRIYDEAVVAALKQLWAAFGLICGKHLAAAMRFHLPRASFLSELGLSEEVREKLQHISPATIDRLLASERKQLTVRGNSHTRVASETMLSRVPVQTYREHPGKPGYFQADLVAHDGGNGSGEFCYTLTATDPVTGWTEPRAVRNKAGKWTTQALAWISAHSPVPLYGWHTDSGAEFLNAHMHRHCHANGIEFTRSRVSKKNDNCHVEQKNDVVVRRYVGYLRYEGEQECALLNELYDSLRLLVNFFYPQRRVTEIERVGSKVTKRYDEPRSPYERVVDSPAVDEQTKAALYEQMIALNPLQLQRQVHELSERLLHSVRAHGRAPQASAGGQ